MRDRARRLALFAHWSPDGELGRYVEQHLDALVAAKCEIAFLTTAALTSRARQGLAARGYRLRVSENRGYDFSMWAAAIADEDLARFDELLLVNSSVIGPVRPLDEVFRAMETRPCDFWGLTESIEGRRHLQSYFLVFRRHAFTSAAFARFFRSVLPFRDKWCTIHSYEIGLTAFLEDEGLRGDALFRWQDLGRHHPVANPMLAYGDELLALGHPYVKIEALRGRPGMYGRGALRAAAEEFRRRRLARCALRAGFDRSCVLSALKQGPASP